MGDGGIDKRTFLQTLAVLGGTSALGFSGTAAAQQEKEYEEYDIEVEPVGIDGRIDQVEEERESALESLVEGLETHGSTYNTDYENTVELYGEEYAPFTFTKGMPLDTDENGDPYPEGIVSFARKLENYRKPMLEQGDIDDSFEQGGDRVFIGAPNVHTVAHTGMDPWRGKMPPAPSPTGVRNAGEMVDVYGMEQLRDAPFTAYPNEPGSGSLSSSEQSAVDALSADLDTVESQLGESWWHSSDRLFVEADTDDVDWGPYISQYLLHDVHMWALPIEQQYRSYEEGDDYNDTLSDWLTTIQGQDEISAELNPNAPESDETSYVSTGRDLATIVNAEPPFQEYLIAGLHLLENSSFADGLPYNSRSDGSLLSYTDGGPVGFLDLLTRAGRQALLAAFYQKYYVHFRCRPETYGGRVHAQLNGDTDFGINSVLTESETLAARDASTDFLSTAFEEGSPVHPAYPSGHSVIAGACGTILKVLFDNTDWEDDYYVPSPDGSSRETISVPSGHTGTYQEIDKLMSNVGLARIFAGVHYYSDHYQAVKLGEQVAVGLLLDFFNRSYTGDEDVDLSFTPFLDYDTEYDVSLDTLETLRSNATSR